MAFTFFSAVNLRLVGPGLLTKPNAETTSLVNRQILEEPQWWHRIPQ